MVAKKQETKRTKPQAKPSRNVATIRLPYPTTGQRAVMSEARRFNVLSAHRGWFKTTLTMSLLVEAMIRNRARTYLWASPTYQQTETAWLEMKQADNGSGAMMFAEGDMICHFRATGSQVYFRSLDKYENIRSLHPDGVVVDEAGKCNPLGWYEVIRPMLINSEGWAWLIGTPKGRNWFYREWLRAKDRENSKSWDIPVLGCKLVNGVLTTNLDNPYINPKINFQEVLDAYETTPEQSFRQEYLSEFVQNEGQVFRNIEPCIHRDNDTREQHSRHYLVAGVDWGKSNDYTAISVWCRDCKKELELDRFNRIDYDFQTERLMSIVTKWGVKLVNAEANSMGEPIIESIRRQHSINIRGVFTAGTTGRNNSAYKATIAKSQLIEALSLAVEKGLVRLVDSIAGTAELEAYEVTLNRSGISTYSAPDGMHDDTVMARALAWNVAQSGGAPLIAMA